MTIMMRDDDIVGTLTTLFFVGEKMPKIATHKTVRSGSSQFLNLPFTFGNIHALCGTSVRTLTHHFLMD